MQPRQISPRKALAYSVSPSAAAVHASLVSRRRLEGVQPLQQIFLPAADANAEVERPQHDLDLVVLAAWVRGDVVELDLPMQARCVEGHPWIESTRGCVAIERGPLVYCLEQADHPGLQIADLEIDATAPLESTWAPDTLDGVAVIHARGWEVDTSAWRHRLYRPLGSAPRAPRRPAALNAIPYFAWANREPGAMRVWIPSAGE